MTVQQLLYFCGALLTLLLGLIGFFGRRMLTQFDTSLAARQAAEQAQAAQIIELTTALKLQTAESRQLRTSLSSLLKSFAAFDRWIYGELQHGTFKTSPPTFSHAGEVPTPEEPA